jgi:hypothetical protein
MIVGAVVDSPDDATSFYRAFGPFRELRKHGVEVVLMNRAPVTWSMMIGIDVLFVLRPRRPDHLISIENAKEYRVPVWIDYDDDFLNVPIGNPSHAYGTLEGMRAKMIRMLGLADAVTFSTRALMESMGPYTSSKARTGVLPNAWDSDLMPEKEKHELEPNAVRRVLWRGSSTHADDLSWAAPGIREASASYPGFQFVFWGYATESVQRAVSDGCQFNYVGPSGVVSYMRALARMNPQIVIVPLQDNAFNRAKSNIAWIEATYAGAVTVAPAYEQWQKPGVRNYKPGNVESFGQTLKHAMHETAYKAIERNRESWAAIADPRPGDGLALNRLNEYRFELLKHLQKGG